ncbi:hypothetical protein DIPPA_04160 [Diplonema papillatum]|nr:hypothetical protein DIPPA_04160 [Diplonema papillatum]
MASTLSLRDAVTSLFDVLGTPNASGEVCDAVVPNTIVFRNGVAAHEGREVAPAEAVRILLADDLAADGPLKKHAIRVLRIQRHDDNVVGSRQPFLSADFLTAPLLLGAVAQQSPPIMWTGILQQFVQPESDQNACYEVNWSPDTIKVECRASKKPLYDPKVFPYERGVTFEGPAYLSERRVLSAKAVHLIKNKCKSIATHVHNITHRAVVHMTLYFKYGYAGYAAATDGGVAKVWLLWCRHVQLNGLVPEKSPSVRVPLQYKVRYGIVKSPLWPQIPEEDLLEEISMGGAGLNEGLTKEERLKLKDRLHRSNERRRQRREEEEARSPINGCRLLLPPFPHPSPDGVLFPALAVNPGSTGKQLPQIAGQGQAALPVVVCALPAQRHEPREREARTPGLPPAPQGSKHGADGPAASGAHPPPQNPRSPPPAPQQQQPPDPAEHSHSHSHSPPEPGVRRTVSEAAVAAAFSSFHRAPCSWKASNPRLQAYSDLALPDGSLGGESIGVYRGPSTVGAPVVVDGSGSPPKPHDKRRGGGRPRETGPVLAADVVGKGASITLEELYARATACVRGETFAAVRRIVRSGDEPAAADSPARRKEEAARPKNRAPASRLFFEKGNPAGGFENSALEKKRAADDRLRVVDAGDEMAAAGGSQPRGVRDVTRHTALTARRREIAKAHLLRIRYATLTRSMTPEAIDARWQKDSPDPSDAGMRDGGAQPPPDEGARTPKPALFSDPPALPDERAAARRRLGRKVLLAKKRVAQRYTVCLAPLKQAPRRLAVEGSARAAGEVAVVVDGAGNSNDNSNKIADSNNSNNNTNTNNNSGNSRKKNNADDAKNNTNSDSNSSSSNASNNENSNNNKNTNDNSSSSRANTDNNSSGNDNNLPQVHAPKSRKPGPKQRLITAFNQARQLVGGQPVLPGAGYGPIKKSREFCFHSPAAGLLPAAAAAGGSQLSVPPSPSGSPKRRNHEFLPTTRLAQATREINAARRREGSNASMMTDTIPDAESYVSDDGSTSQEGVPDEDEKPEDYLPQNLAVVLAHWDRALQSDDVKQRGTMFFQHWQGISKANPTSASVASVARLCERACEYLTGLPYLVTTSGQRGAAVSFVFSIPPGLAPLQQKLIDFLTSLQHVRLLPEEEVVTRRLHCSAVVIDGLYTSHLDRHRQDLAQPRPPVLEITSHISQVLAARIPLWILRNLRAYFLLRKHKIETDT